MPDPEKSADEIQTRRLRSYALALLIGLATAGSLMALLRWMASEVFEGETDAFDQAVRNGIHSIASPVLTSFFIGVSFIGSPAFLTVLGVTAVIALIYLGNRRAAVLLVITMVGEVALDLGLKGIYTRVRPEPFFDYALPTSFSFPSGHALGSFCFYGIAAWLISTRAKNSLIKWAVPSAASLLILLIGISRVYLGVHYPTDVLAGYTAGLVWTGTVCLGDRYFLKPRTAID